MFLTATGSPFSTIKTKALNRKDLAPSERFDITKGTKIAVGDKPIDQVGIHQLYELMGDLTITEKGQIKARLRKGDRYWFAPVEWSKPLALGLINKPLVAGEYILDVPYFPQTDNIRQPERTCNTSSNAMALKYLGADISGDDDFWERFVNVEGDTTDHSAMGRAIDRLGIKNQWRNDLGFDDLDHSIIVEKKPVVIGILHRGSWEAPCGGHMILVIGKKGSDYVVNDPYGSLMDGYTGSVYNGHKAVYSRYELTSRWLDSDQSEAHSGWGRLFY